MLSTCRIPYHQEQLPYCNPPALFLFLQRFVPRLVRTFRPDPLEVREVAIVQISGVRVKSGISVSSEPFHDTCINEYAEKIALNLDLHGAWFFQLKRDHQETFKILEIAPRIAGTMALHRVQGINFPLLSILEQQGIPLSILRNSETVKIDRALTNRYHHTFSFDTVYVDLDDTLLFCGKINLELIRFLYQCINNNIKLVLLTKHQDEPSFTLEKCRLSTLFDEIIHLQKNQPKSAYITTQNSIFIDDSFSERQNVSLEHGIPTFDSSMIELLIDERM